MSTDLVVLHADGARDLLQRCRWQAVVLSGDAAALARSLDAAASFVSTDVAAQAAIAPALVRAAADGLGGVADDLAWRIAYVEALTSDGTAIALPRRSVELQRLSVPAIVERLATSEGDELLDLMHELVIRGSTDPVIARTISRHLGVEETRALRRLVEAEMDELVFDAEFRRPSFPTEETLAAQAERVESVRALADAYAMVLAGLSHDSTGRSTLREVFGLASPDDRTEGLVIALRAGRWNGDFLLDLALGVLDDPRPLHGHFGTDLSVMAYPMGRQFFPRLDDPHAVLFEALARSPAAARAFMYDHDGFWRLHHLSDAYFERFTTGISQAVPGRRLEDAIVQLARVAYTDPEFVTEAHAAFIGDYRPHEDRRNTGVLWAIAHDDGYGHELTMVLAEAWAMQWGNLADLRPEDAVSNTLGGDALAVLMRDDEAREHILGSFAPFLEARFADAFRSRDPDAVRDAVDSAEIAFELLDAGLDRLPLDADDQRLLRSAFAAGVGYAARTGAASLGMPAFPAAVMVFLAGELARAGGDRLSSGTTSVYPSTQSLLESLFIGGDAPDGGARRQPALGEIALATAALAAHPEIAASLPSAPWYQNGQIVPPVAAGDADDFARWFLGAVNGDPTLRSLVTDTVEELAQRAATVSTPG